MLVNTHNVFDDRKNEIEFYYSVMIDLNDESKQNIITINNQRFFRIMKSNFILMLYNLVESTFTSGMAEIYDGFAQDICSYDSVIDEIQDIWRDSKIKQLYKSDSGLNTYTKQVKKIVDDITRGVPLSLTKETLGMNGNLNAKNIKKICDKHRIRYRVTDDNLILDQVKKKRNSLAHGDESFGRCTRDMTMKDLENIKDTVLRFISEIVIALDKYYDEKQYLRKK